jgi:hypothetical protein
MTTGTLSKKIEKIVSPKEKPRDYIGASGIGEECVRAVWYSYNGSDKEEFSPRIQRILETGKILEDYVISLLEQTGMTIERACDENNWHTYVAKNQPYFRGHFDGIIRKPKSLVGALEIKSANDARYTQFVKMGLKKWSPMYYAQAQSYMGMSGFDKTFVVVLNKNSSAIMDETILFDAPFYDSLCKKAAYVHQLTAPPPRVSESPIWHQCKMCKFRKECHK